MCKLIYTRKSCAKLTETHHRPQVSYNEKHNDANGEGNRDGTNDNFSWNCGAEGGRGGDVPHGVAALRERQMRNMHLALMLSQGVPMLVAGAWVDLGEGARAGGYT